MERRGAGGWELGERKMRGGVPSYDRSHELSLCLLVVMGTI